MSRCAAFESNCVSVKDVTPWMIVATSTAPTMGRSNCVWWFVTTLSMRKRVEYGSTNPETRLMAMSTRPSASRPLRGLISAQISGHAMRRFTGFFLGFSGFAAAGVAIRIGRNARLRRCNISPRRSLGFLLRARQLLQLRCQDEVALGESVHFVCIDAHLDLSPGEADVGMVPFLLGDGADLVHQFERGLEIGKLVGPRQMMAVDDLPSRHLFS